MNEQLTNNAFLLSYFIFRYDRTWTCDL